MLVWRLDAVRLLGIFRLMYKGLLFSQHMGCVLIIIFSHSLHLMGLFLHSFVNGSTCAKK